MIDWLTFKAPLRHRTPITGGRVLSIAADGSMEWATEKFAKVVGSHYQNLMVKTDTRYIDSETGDYLVLHVSGNPVKWIQGHNLFGTDDVHGLVIEAMERLAVMLGVEPSPDDRQAWVDGRVTLSRVDINYSWELRNRGDVRAFIRSAELTAHMRHRGRGQLTKGGTLYYGKNSRRWALKLYCKGDEIQAKGHQLPEALQETSLATWADNKLRIEAVIRSMELERLNLRQVSHWEDHFPAELHTNYLAGLEMSDPHKMTPELLDTLPNRIRAAYQLWKDGHDLRNMYSRPTFYRYRKELMEHGVDIAIVQPRDEEPTNVVPLVRILEAKPAEIPDWAVGTPLYFEPKINAR